MCNLSPAYFSRRFKRVFGMNFTDYVRTYRLHLAARRILTTGAPVSDIDYGLGFASPSHFTARFHERFGETPRDYRQSVRRRQDTETTGRGDDQDRAEDGKRVVKRQKVYERGVAGGNENTKKENKKRSKD